MKCCLFCAYLVLSSVPQLESEPAVEQIGETPDDVPFAIPEKWKWVQLNNVTTQITDGTHHSPVSFSKEDPRGKFLYITAKNIKFTGVDCSTATYVTEDTHKEITSRCFPEYRDVLYIKDGATTGVVTVNNIEEPFSLLSSVALIKPIKLMLDPDFLSFTLRSKSMTDLMRGKMKGTGIPRVTLKILKKFSIPLPPLEEQHRIVAKLNELLPLVETYGKEEEALEKLGKEFPDKLRASLLLEAIQGKLVPQLESEPEVEQIGEAPEDVPFAIPEKWKWVKLENLGRWKSGGTPSRSHREYYENGTIPWLKTGDLNDGVIQSVGEYITNLGLDNSSAHINPAGSVLIAMYGATIGKVGILQFPCATNQACCACVLKESICDQWYLFYFLLSQRKNFIALGAGGAQPNISRTKIVNSWIPLPPLEEQRRIVAKLTEVLNIARQLENSASIP